MSTPKAPISSGAAIKYIPPPPAPLPADYDEFYAAMTTQERELFEIAREKLGSSFFVQWSHLYKRWKAAKAANAEKAANATKAAGK